MYFRYAMLLLTYHKRKKKPKSVTSMLDISTETRKAVIYSMFLQGSRYKVTIFQEVYSLQAGNSGEFLTGCRHGSKKGFYENLLGYDVVTRST